MGYFESLLKKPRLTCKFLYEEPELNRIPNVLTDDRFSELVSFKGYSNIDEEKLVIAHSFISGLIYRATGLFYELKNMVLRYDAGEAGNTFLFPFKCQVVNSLKVDGNIIPISAYDYDRFELRSDWTFALDNIYIDGVFGDVKDDISNDIELAVSILLEDYIIGDKYDRMQSLAKEITLDKLRIVMPENIITQTITGNSEVDRLLAPHALPNSLIAKKYSLMYRMTAL